MATCFGPSGGKEAAPAAKAPAAAAAAGPKKIVVDPVTRIEGHLKVEVTVAEGKVVEARTTGGALSSVSASSSASATTSSADRAFGCCAGAAAATMVLPRPLAIASL